MYQISFKNYYFWLIFAYNMPGFQPNFVQITNLLLISYIFCIFLHIICRLSVKKPLKFKVWIICRCGLSIELFQIGVVPHVKSYIYTMKCEQLYSLLVSTQLFVESLMIASCLTYTC